MSMKGSERWAIGLMTGTSMDGIDAALIETDGSIVASFGATSSEPYDESFSGRLRELLGEDPIGKPATPAIEAELTDRHAAAVENLIAESGVAPSDIAVIGFHGQTIFHAPERNVTIQIGDAQRLADKTGIPVVARFRQADVAAGGQGAPFAPLYHRALARDLGRPLAVLNLGGVANVTWLGDGEGDILAFDTGPASAMIDDWVRRHTGAPFDADGRLAAGGTTDRRILDQLLDNPYFDLPPPKSLDRNAFCAASMEGLGVNDGAATLLAFSVESVARCLRHLPHSPARWIVCGGGRRNAAMMAALNQRLGVPVEPAETVGWDGDVLEAQAFAFLAVRSLDGLPLSMPTTTGVERPMPGGELFRPG